jgi:hypothetical protein
MFGPPTSELLAGAQALIVAACLIGFGYLISDALAGRRKLDEVERWGLALAGLCFFALVLMVVHMATSGWLFAHPGVVRAVTGVAALALLVRRLMRRGERDGSHTPIAFVLAVASVAVWGSPVFRMLPLTATADTQLHNGWIEQLLSGDPTFGAVLTGDVPNYYPWLFHSLGALTTTISPGGTAYHSLGPLQLALVAGAVLALFALGRALTGRAVTGFGAALLGALCGGFGFVMLNGLDLIADPRAQDGAAALTYQGDLLFSRSYNLGFHNLAPPFPRDLAFALLISFLLMVGLRARDRTEWSEVGTGCVLGLVGLTGGETFIVGSAFVLMLAMFDSPRRLVSLARMLGSALAIYALWVVPMVLNYADLGGFVSITHIIAVALPASAIVVSWGITTPLALAWLARGPRALSDRAGRFCLLFMITAGTLLLISAWIPELFGDAFDTLGRKHRYWPIFYLSVALAGALGLTRVLTWLATKERSVAVAVGALLAATALASPVVASLALPTHIGRYPEIGAAMTGADESLLNVLRDAGPGCVVAVPQEVSREVFSYTGFRMVLWTGNWFGANRARIRWADIYERIAPEARRIADNKILVTGEVPADGWRLLAERHGVDRVVAPAARADARGFEGVTPIEATYGSARYLVFTTGSCTDAESRQE